ncbi:unnamed protein product [Symbiodinium natans]|uniref:Uncharacterized protein n=1 Tax=Symbiodinium natans TaxID=878477 RepID=A0A812QNT3_9DINO|nr:unnamed protein product [Symbiodinium natans]
MPPNTPSSFAPGLLGTGSESSKRDVPKMSPEPWQSVGRMAKFMKVKAKYAREKMRGIARKITEDIVHTATAGKEGQSFEAQLFEREKRIAQVKYRLEVTAARLHVASVGKDKEDEPWDEGAEMKKFFRDNEIAGALRNRNIKDLRKSDRATCACSSESQGYETSTEGRLGSALLRFPWRVGILVGGWRKSLSTSAPLFKDPQTPTACRQLRNTFGTPSGPQPPVPIPPMAFLGHIWLA